MAKIPKKYQQETYTRADLESLVKSQAGIGVGQARVAVATVFNALLGAMANGDTVKISGFGEFKGKEFEEKWCVDPRNGKMILIGKHYTPTLRFYRSAKDTVKEASYKREEILGRKTKKNKDKNKNGDES